MEIEKKQEVINDILKIVAPGTMLRQGIDNILRAKTGGLIVVGYNGKVQDLVDGGFSIDCRFTPAYLYELAKMDGAIIINKEANKILYANTQLIPDTTIPSTETGIRHRTAERVAKQTGNLVISISQRRNVITLYQGNIRYSLKEIGVILTKANQAMQTLEKYKSVLDQGITDLGALEFEELATLQEVAQVIHRIEMVLRIKQEILNYINELGTEGRLISMQMEELVTNLEAEARWLIGDYVKDVDETPADVMKRLKKLTSDDLLEDHSIMKILGYEEQNEAVKPRGYRILHKIPRLPSNIIENLVSSFGNLNDIATASIEELDKVEGIGEIRAKKIKAGLKRIQEQLFVDRHI
ncbi:DNA integrity scanning diadenylate cyclase DisA [Alkalihalobacillus sp. CinArs1]|uniref:DNA integrity scanning diadenylate cyclase DisA n=1 Tax=Alkalihalobacillus sp. CinArs1 TaxID=2995314 RepID=UPI0022DD4129|nr:DNA integrity scanning diadenylate cyclase DisA [Alkalihalobacillus sp. CinArs1]